MLQIRDKQVLHQAKAEIKGRAGIRDQITHDLVVLHKAPLQRNLAQYSFQNVFLTGEFLHFAVREFGSLENSQRDYFGAVANQEGALFLGTLQSQLNTTLHVKRVYFLECIFALGRSRWFRVSCTYSRSCGLRGSD